MFISLCLPVNQNKKKNVIYYICTKIFKSACITLKLTRVHKSVNVVNDNIKSFVVANANVILFFLESSGSHPAASWCSLDGVTGLIVQ